MDSITLKKPDKQHSVLDFEMCERLFRNTEQGQWHCGSPNGIYHFETDCRRFGFDNHSSLPADLFVWGEGEPEKTYLTKVGGVPYLPQTTPWQHNAATGKPYVFLAQICFVDSKDTLSVSVPGDVLLIFMKDDLAGETYVDICDEQDELHFEWVQIGNQPTWNKKSMKANGFQSVKKSYFGVIHRTQDYNMRSPEVGASDEFFDMHRERSAQGTKIGGVPNFQQGGPANYGWNYDEEKQTWDDATYIAEFGSVFFECSVPFPWCNRKRAIQFKTQQKKAVMICDVGSLYLFMKPNGKIVWLAEGG
jgi:uncharacterized protein YwqG